jgi:Fe-Mn family superoxide dismutase
MDTRREFLKKIGVAAVATSTVATKTFADDKKIITAALIPEADAILPDLPYSYDALEPFIDKETMELHHSKHHKAYVDGVNNARKKLKEARDNNDYSLVEHWSKKLAFHSGGHFLHTLFWNCMAPKSKNNVNAPSKVLLDRINLDFGSFDNFKKQFSAAANAVEGSGWALLHCDNKTKSLAIMIAENQHKLSPWGTTPILGIDVWEHAYYLKYRNKRADYVTAWWEVVAWNNVSKNYEQV